LCGGDVWGNMFREGKGPTARCACPIQLVACAFDRGVNPTRLLPAAAAVADDEDAVIWARLNEPSMTDDVLHAARISQRLICYTHSPNHKVLASVCDPDPCKTSRHRQRLYKSASIIWKKLVNLNVEKNIECPYWKVRVFFCEAFWSRHWYFYYFSTM